MPSVREGVRGAAFLAAVYGRLRRLLGVADARALLEARRAGRADGFLELLRRSVYGAPASPYGPLLRAAGCEYGDVEGLVRQTASRGRSAPCCAPVCSSP